MRAPAAPGLRPGPLGVKGPDGFLEVVAADEPHRVVRAAPFIQAHPVDRDNPGVFQAAGDLGLEQEAVPADRVVGVAVEDLLERDLAVELRVPGHEHFAQAPTGRVA